MRYWRSHPLKQRTGSDIFASLFLSNEIATLLESPFPTPEDQPQLSRYSICAGSPLIVNNKPQLWTPKLGEILAFLQELLIKNKPDHNAPKYLPFTGGWLGWLGYDLAWEIENLPCLNQDNLPFPVAYWYEPACLAILDHQEQILWLAAPTKIQLNELEYLLENNRIINNINTIDSQSKIFYFTGQNNYESAVRKAKEYITAGDIFQANLSLRFQIATNLDSWTIYQNLHQINPSPFASYWQTPWGAVISCSPERLVKLDGNKAETRPIAGTRPRGQTDDQDQQLAQELKDNVKEIAEHIMLVDLERNDLGKVCQWGTVRVDELLAIERYSHVMHLVSNVTGILATKYTPIDLIRGLFPGGTITGCPKVRCLEIIEELEPVRRSLFYGSCGFLDKRGNLDLNILIRTLLYAPNSNQENLVWGQVGAGIVADSDPQKEWYESLQKAKAQLKALKLDK
jgi:para-aminobenzoate synthetase component 1